MYQSDNFYARQITAISIRQPLYQSDNFYTSQTTSIPVIQYMFQSDDFCTSQITYIPVRRLLDHQMISLPFRQSYQSDKVDIT